MITIILSTVNLKLINFILFLVFKWITHNFLLCHICILPHIHANISRLMPNVSLDCYLIYFSQKASLISVWMRVDIFRSKIKKLFLHLFLLVTQWSVYLLQINYPINLTSSQLTQPIFTTRTNSLLIHITLIPIFR